MNTKVIKLDMLRKEEALKVIVDALYEDEYYSVAPKQDLIDLYDIIYDIAFMYGDIIAITDMETGAICGVAVFVAPNKIKNDEQIFDFVLGIENEAFSSAINKFNEIMLEDSKSTYLYGIGVDAKYRGHGLGSQLILGSSQLLGGQKMYADVTHASVLPFYEKLGFEVIPIENMFLIRK